VTYFVRETLTIDKDLLYLSNVCKRIKHVSIQVEYFDERVDSDDNDILSETDEEEPSESIELPPIGTQPWEQPLQELKSLESLAIKCFCWTDVYSLICVVGKQLRFLKMEQREYRPRGRFMFSQPRLDILLQMCSNIKKLQLDLMEELKLSDEDSMVDLSKIRTIKLFTQTSWAWGYVRKETFFWIWSRIRDLHELDLVLPHNQNTISRDETVLLLESNPKIRIKSIRCNLNIDRIETARLFVDSLRLYGAEQIEFKEIKIQYSDVTRIKQDIEEWLDYVEMIKNPDDGKHATVVEIRLKFVGDHSVLSLEDLEWMGFMGFAIRRNYVQ